MNELDQELQASSLDKSETATREAIDKLVELLQEENTREFKRLWFAMAILGFSIVLLGVMFLSR